MRLRFLLCVLCLLVLSPLLTAQTAAPERVSVSFQSAWSIGAEYSNTSSHILLGSVQNRRIAAVDLTYSRRLLHRRAVDWHNDFEVQPAFFLQDPMRNAFYRVRVSGTPPTIFRSDVPIARACRSFFGSYQNPLNTVATMTRVRCETRWTYAGGMSPLGQRFNFATSHRLQPVFLINPGFVASARDIPLPGTSSLNFTFDVGAGLQWFRDTHHAWMVDYRFHHLSNAYLGADPGVDSQVVHVTYSFGR